MQANGQYANTCNRSTRKTVRGAALALGLLLVPATGIVMSGTAVHASDLPPPPRISAVPIPKGQIDKALAELDKRAEALMARTGIPGMAVAVVHEGRTVYAKGFGVRKAGEAAPVDADTVFQLASLSKSLTGTIVAQQVGAGIVAWDTPIVQHLPWFALKDPWVTRHVTIADMLSHRSGLADHAGDALEDIGYDQRQVLERLALLPLSPFRITYDYTNFGFTAGAEAVAAAAGKDWASLAEDALYKPLGMASTSSRFADFIARPNHAVGHVKVDGTYQAKFQRQPDAQSPAGGVSSSVRDMARWMALVLQGGRFEGRQIVPGEALLPAITAQIISSHSDVAEARPSFYGHGFGVGISPSGRTEIKHSGAFALGAGTAYTLLPSAGLGIVVLTNTTPIGVPEALTADFLDLVQFGRIERDWLAAYGPFMAPMTQPVGGLAGKTRPASPAPAAALALYAGTYRNPYYGPAHVVQQDGGLVLKLGPKDVAYPLEHWDGSSFGFQPISENEPPGSMPKASFTQTGTAPATSLTIDYFNSQGLGTFVRE